MQRCNAELLLVAVYFLSHLRIELCRVGFYIKLMQT